jgi:hypothetical protein
MSGSPCAGKGSSVSCMFHTPSYSSILMMEAASFPDVLVIIYHIPHIIPRRHYYHENLKSHSGIHIYRMEYMICFSTRSAWPVKQHSETEQCGILNFITGVSCQINRFCQKSVALSFLF